MIQYWNIPDELRGDKEQVCVEIMFEKIEAHNIIVSTLRLTELAYPIFMVNMMKRFKSLKTKYNITMSFGREIKLMAKDAVNTACLKDLSLINAWAVPVIKSLTVHGNVMTKWFKRVGSYKNLHDFDKPVSFTNSILIEPRSFDLNDDMITGKIRVLGDFKLKKPTLFPSSDNMNRLRIVRPNNDHGFADGRLVVCCESFLSLKGTILRPDLLECVDYWKRVNDDEEE